MGRNALGYLVVAIIVLAGLFYLFKPKSVTITPPPSSTPTESTSSASPTSQGKTFDLSIKDKKLVSGPDTLQVREGDQVTINITSDEDEEFHLHGYDKSVDLESGKTAKLQFTANLTGRFPFELEKSKTEIGALEVMP